MLSLHTNAAALSTKAALGATQNGLTKSLTRLGTGLRVNTAMDDAAGMQIATRLNAQSRGMAVAQRNAQNGISQLQVAEGALGEVSNLLLRMKDLATDSANGSVSDDDRTAMQKEYDALGDELNNIVTNTSFGGEALLTSSTGKFAAAGGVDYQIGAASAETMTVDVATDMGTMATDLTAVTVNFATAGTGGAEISTQADANTIIDEIQTAIDSVGAVRSGIGAAANRLDHVYNNLGTMIQGTDAAKGRIVDVDYAAESANMTSKQILMQAGSAMLKQASSMNQMIASLVQ
jgi:flagellin